MSERRIHLNREQFREIFVGALPLFTPGDTKTLSLSYESLDKFPGAEHVQISKTEDKLIIKVIMPGGEIGVREFPFKAFSQNSDN